KKIVRIFRFAHIYGWKENKKERKSGGVMMDKKNLAKRYFLLLCLALSLALLGGCSYSASSTSESSVSITANGEPQVKASTSVNVERSMDGKSVSQKASIKLDSQNGSGVSLSY
ncbi:MAG: hypothetical protein IKR40_00795, partial [Treponema sp.]|nr:hypothetical protein [Treponema sp.]